MENWWTRESGRASFEERFPRWRCPGCSNVSRYLSTFFETCQWCKEDHTLDWDEYKVDADSA